MSTSWGIRVSVYSRSSRQFVRAFISEMYGWNTSLDYYSLALSPDGTRIFVANSIVVYEFDTDGQLLQTYNMPHGPTNFGYISTNLHRGGGIAVSDDFLYVSEVCHYAITGNYPYNTFADNADILQFSRDTRQVVSRLYHANPYPLSNRRNDVVSLKFNPAQRRLYAKMRLPYTSVGMVKLPENLATAGSPNYWWWVPSSDAGSFNWYRQTSSTLYGQEGFCLHPTQLYHFWTGSNKAFYPTHKNLYLGSFSTPPANAAYTVNCPTVTMYTGVENIEKQAVAYDETSDLLYCISRSVHRMRAHHAGTLALTWRNSLPPNPGSVDTPPEYLYRPMDIAIHGDYIYVLNVGQAAIRKRPSISTVYDALFGFEHNAVADGNVNHYRALPGGALSAAEAMGPGVDCALTVLPNGDLGALIKQADGTRLRRISHDDGRTWEDE